MSDKPAVTVLGLGRMGAAIAAAFRDAGYRTTVWNRTPKPGAAPTAATAVAASPLVIASLLDHQALRQTLDPVDLRGRVLVNLANGTPEEARETAAWAAERGADYLDGVMLALPDTVATPEAFFLYSGSREAVATYRDALEVMAAVHYYGTDPGMAEIHDLAILGTGYAALAGFLHAAALLDTAGTSPAELAPLAASWLTTIAGFLPELAGEAAARTYGNATSTVDMNLAAVNALLRLSRAAGLDTGVHEPLHALLDRRSADGHGDDSFSSLFELLRRPDNSVGQRPFPSDRERPSALLGD